MRRALTTLVPIVLLAVPAAAEEVASVGFGAGIFDTAAWFDDAGEFDAVEAGVVVRGATRWALGIGPVAGISANDDGAYWIYGGARRPFRLDRCWHVGPTFAAAYYEPGDGKDLGHELEFRSGLEIFCLGGSGRAFGFEFYHLSNASISDVNPGSNSLWFYFSVPLGGR
jgi:hypothetical protein